MHLAAIEAHLQTRGSLPVNVKVVIEGEEEIGSPNFEAALATYESRLAADLALISDTAVYSEDVPSLTTSICGSVNWEITVTGPAEYSAFGLLRGLSRQSDRSAFAADRAAKDGSGRVAVPGFYEGVREPDATMRAQLAVALDSDEASEARAMQVPAIGGERGPAPLERQWLRPTLECNGIWGGYQGPGSKTIIPVMQRQRSPRV